MYNFAESAFEANPDLFAMRCIEETLNRSGSDLDLLEDEPWDFSDIE